MLSVQKVRVMRLKRVFILFSLIITIGCFEIAVKVKQGIVIGVTEATILEGRRFYAFYGIPYAQPPIGRLRFKDPVAAKKWQQPFDATLEYHSACAQSHIAHKHALYGNEDCLYLNVFTPQVSKKTSENLKAVIVWIHGYAFANSFSHIYGADFFIENDVVLVTVSHRIGVFGFLKVNETDSSANMGLKDIVMALKWIRTNINQFAGDKTKVTVMGSGSAATFLSWLLMTKKRRMFSKMILQSGAPFAPSLFPRSDDFEKKKVFQEVLKSDKKKDFLKSTTDEIIAATGRIYKNMDTVNYQRPIVPFAPILEIKSNKSLISVRPEEFFSRKLNVSLPILIGFSSQESISEVIPFIHNPNYLKMFAQVFKFMVPFSDGCQYNYSTKMYEQVGIKIKSEYFKDGISENSVTQFLRYTSDLSKYPVYKFIKTLAGLRLKKLFVYKFNYVGRFNAVKANSVSGANMVVKGAASGDELCYLLKCEPMWENYVHLKNDSANKDIKMIRQMSKWWADFAKTGDPTSSQSSGLEWPAVVEGAINLMLIGKESRVIQAKSEEKLYKFWTDIYEKFYRKDVCSGKTHDEL